jgi:hypothetical protein
LVSTGAPTGEVNLSELSLEPFGVYMAKVSK